MQIAFKEISYFLIKKGFYTNEIFLNVYKFFVGLDSGGWHIGSDLLYESKIDVLKNSKNIFFADSSTIGHVPSTTVGPLYYAHAKTIVENSLKD